MAYFKEQFVAQQGGSVADFGAKAPFWELANVAPEGATYKARVGYKKQPSPRRKETPARRHQKTTI